MCAPTVTLTATCRSTQVHRVFPSGLAAQQGTIQKGDELLSINGQSLRDVTHASATAALRQARSHRLAVVVICRRAADTQQDGLQRGQEDGPAGQPPVLVSNRHSLVLL